MKKYFALCVVFLVIFIAIANGSDMQTAIREADKKLKANGYLLSEEIEEIWEQEKTPDIIEKLSQEQQKLILEEYRAAQNIVAKNSLEFGTSIKDELERSMYQEGVRKNKTLKLTREIAQKYGIKAGDIFTIEFHITLATLEGK